MDPVDNRLAHTTQRAPRPTPKPVERELVEVTTTTKELREKCTCGALVIMEQYSSRDHIRYVRCPKCGRKHALDDRKDTIRPVR